MGAGQLHTSDSSFDDLMLGARRRQSEQQSRQAAVSGRARNNAPCGLIRGAGAASALPPGAQTLSAWADRAGGGADAVARKQQRRGAPRAATHPGIRDALPRAGRHQGPRQHYRTPAPAPGDRVSGQEAGQDLLSITSSIQQSPATVWGSSSGLIWLDANDQARASPYRRMVAASQGLLPRRPPPAPRDGHGTRCHPRRWPASLTLR